MISRCLIDYDAARREWYVRYDPVQPASRAVCLHRSYACWAPP